MTAQLNEAQFLQRAQSLHAKQQFDLLFDLAQSSVNIMPHSYPCWTYLGVAARALGRWPDAEAAFCRASSLKPSSPAALNNHAIALKSLGRLDEAEALFKRIIDLDPGYAQGYSNLGNVYQARRQFQKAIVAYERAIELDPSQASAWNNLGNARRSLGDIEKAESAYLTAVRVNTDHYDAYINLGNACQERRESDRAATYYAEALARVKEPKVRLALSGHLAHVLGHQCDWDGVRKLGGAHLEGALTGRLPPFVALNFCDDPAFQLVCAQTYVQRSSVPRRAHINARHLQPGERLRIGYFGSDFHDHATLYLMAGLLRAHDTENFEVHVFSYGAETSGKWREAVAHSVEHFHDVSALSDIELVSRVRAASLDVAIDLKGHTQGTRLNVFGYGLAPTQISYLGYPGSTGADFIDYIVADKTVIDQASRGSYCERVIYLPYTYQPNDDAREIAPGAMSRSECGLPDGAFVFCCMNHNYKITSAEFSIWMSLLANVDDAVLWLLKSNSGAEENLRAAAIAAGIDPSRLIFAPHIPHAEHLARYRHADLFLDTFTVNAHTTASDALWSGVPVLTKLGQQYAARVAASLLKAHGCPELITRSEEDYAARALELALDREQLALLREKVAANRATEALFDTVRYTRHFEEALLRAHSAALSGERADIFIGA